MKRLPSFAAALVFISMGFFGCSSDRSKDSVEPPGFNLLIIDSGFAPKPGLCAWAHDGHLNVPDEGPCFDAASWESLRRDDPKALADYLDVPNAAWKEYKSRHAGEAQALKLAYDLNAHGTMVAEVAAKGSDGLARPRFLRNLDGQAGAASLNAVREAKWEGDLERYDARCPLINWKKSKSYSEGPDYLEPFERRISRQLSENPGIRVVNISSGFRRSWITEDLPGCAPGQAGADFDSKAHGWRDLFKKFPKVLFVTSSGNESSDFSDAAQRRDHLWARLSDEPNLVLVGAVNENGQPLRLSNFGLKNMLWGKGVFELDQPNPIDSARPAKIRFFGTSAAAPWISGLAVKFFSERPGVPVNEVLAELRKTWVLSP